MSAEQGPLASIATIAHPRLSRRLLGGACDAAVFWILLLPGVGAVVNHLSEQLQIVYAGPATEPLLGQHSGIVAVGILVLGAAGWASLQWPGLCTHGQSIGKRVAGLRIVADGRPPGFVRGVLLRQLFPIVFPVICWLWLWPASELPAGLGELAMLPLALAVFWVPLLDATWCLGTERRCLHDRLARTHVVRSSPHPQVRPRRQP